VGRGEAVLFRASLRRRRRLQYLTVQHLAFLVIFELHDAIDRKAARFKIGAHFLDRLVFHLRPLLDRNRENDARGLSLDQLRTFNAVVDVPHIRQRIEARDINAALDQERHDLLARFQLDLDSTAARTGDALRRLAFEAIKHFLDRDHVPRHGVLDELANYNAHLHPLAQTIIHVDDLIELRDKLNRQVAAQLPLRREGGGRPNRTRAEASGAR
jgi:hypothetical protein